jgi:ATP-dependent RNA helicase RhlE
VSFITCDNAAHFSLIEKRLGAGAAVPRVVVTGFEPKDVPSPTPAGGGRLGRGGGDGGFVEGLVQGVRHSPLGLAHDRMHGGVKGRKKSKKDKLREAAAAAAAAATTTQRQGEGNVH